ncbi:hypothetical protein PI126_g12019 [Phytophthora idaei]|nr:hypothetical protein PI126_g12019 [Phytophthora idaei]
MGTKQQPARPPHGVAVKQSPLTARARHLETTTFPRSDLWSWTDDGAKDELIESMLRECVPPMAVPSTPALNGTAPLALAGNNRPLLVSQRQKLVTASQHSHLQLPMSSQTSRKTRNLQSPPTSLPPPQLQPSSSKNLAAAVAAAAASAGQDGWKAFKVAHRSNKVLTKTRQMISVLTCQNSSKKNENDGEDQHSHADGNAGTSGDEADPNEKEEETEEMRIAAAAAAKLMEAKAKFQREVLDEDTSQGSSTNGVGDVQNGAEDFWRLYKNSTTSKRPDSTRGRYIANCQNSSLLLVWKNKTDIVDSIHNGTAQRIMEHFGTFERDPTTGCLFRGEVFIVLFSRIVDEWNLSETLSLLDLTTKTQVLDRLGVLNCFHPLQQIETYRNLQLNALDQRQLILIIVKLAASGEAELTNTQLNGDIIESDVWKTWTSDDKLPSQGVLSCSMRALHGVQSEAQLPPTSVRKKLMQSLLFKLEDKAQELTLL